MYDRIKLRRGSDRKKSFSLLEWRNFKGLNTVDNNTNLPQWQVPAAQNVDFSRIIGAASKRYGLEGLFTSLGTGSVKGIYTYRRSSGDSLLFGHGTDCYKLSGDTTTLTKTSQADWQAGTCTDIDTTTSAGDITIEKTGVAGGNGITTVPETLKVVSGGNDLEYGWKFTVGSTDIVVTKLRLLFGTTGNATVRLWQVSDKSKIAEVVISAVDGSWAEGDITDIVLTAGASYIVTVGIPAGTYYRNFSTTSWAINSAITNVIFAYGTTLDTYPTTITATSEPVGIVDIYIQPGYESEGTWISPAYDLTNTPLTSTLTRTETTPASTSVTWSVRGSTDNQNFGDWQTIVTSGDGIPLTRYIQVKAVLATTDGTVTPTVSAFTVTCQTSFTSATSIKSSLSGDTIRFSDWDDRCWFCEGGRPQVYDGTSVVNVGIDPPTAPTLAVGAATGLTGTFYGKVTYVNDGAESNASDASSSVTVSNQKITWTIPTGPTGTTARKLYRTKNGGTTYYLLTTISDNTTTSYTDTMADGSLVTELDTDNDIPPDSDIVHFHKNYAIYVSSADPTKWYYSKPSNPHAVPDINYEQCPGPILGVATYAEQLVLFGKNFTQAVDGDIFDPTSGDYTIRTIDTIGALSHESVAECMEPELRNILVFPVSTGIKYLTPGFQEKSLLGAPISRNVQTYFDGAVSKENMTALFHNQCYYIAFNQYDTGEAAVGYNNKILMLDMRTREWNSPWTINCAGFAVANGQLYIADSTKGLIYLHTGSDDDGSNINMILDSNYVGGDRKSRFRKMRLHVKKGSDTTSTVITTRTDDREGTINVGACTGWSGASGSTRTVQDEVTSPEFIIPAGYGYNFGWRIADNSDNDVVIYGVTVRYEPSDRG